VPPAIQSLPHSSEIKNIGYNYNKHWDPGFFDGSGPLFRIHDILVWIRIRGSMPLINGSGGPKTCESGGFGYRIRIRAQKFFTYSDPLEIGPKEGVKFTPKNFNFYVNVLFNLLLNKKF
jgi:hypothetical protein